MILFIYSNIRVKEKGGLKRVVPIFSILRFHDYLGHGAEFTVYTDNNLLTYVMTSAKLNATGMRWVSQLADYSFVIRYKKQKQIVPNN